MFCFTFARLTRTTLPFAPQRIHVVLCECVFACVLVQCLQLSPLTRARHTFADLRWFYCVPQQQQQPFNRLASGPVFFVWPLSPRCGCDVARRFGSSMVYPSHSPPYPRTCAYSILSQPRTDLWVRVCVCAIAHVSFGASQNHWQRVCER